MTVTQLINGPEAFTPDNEFCLGETEVAGLRGCGFCAHGLAGAGGIGKVMAEWIVEGEPASTSGTWTSAASARTTAPRATRSPARENYETYYDIRYPRPRAVGRAARCGRRRPTGGTGARRGLRREVRLGAGQLVRGERGGRRRGAAPTRLGRPALVAGDRRRAPRPGRRVGAVRRVVVRQDRGRRARRAGIPRAAVRQRVAARSAAITYTRCSTAAAASSATSRSRGSAEERSGSSPARRSATTTAVDPQPPPAGGAVARRAT